MKQIFLNLFLNAIQAMPEGGKLRIKTKVVDGPCPVQIEIQDEGAGILDQIKDRLFEPLFTTKEEGIGLGLSIVKRIIDDHKGSIEVRDNYPRGTVFIVNLPTS